MTKTSQEFVWEFDGSYARKFRVNYEDKADRDTRVYLEELEEDTNGYEVNKSIELERNDIENLYELFGFILKIHKI